MRKKINIFSYENDYDDDGKLWWAFVIRVGRLFIDEKQSYTRPSSALRRARSIIRNVLHMDPAEFKVVG